MTKRFILSLGALTAAMVFACSPDPGPFFVPQKFPEDQTSFNAGRLGLITPALSREDELIAFRLLSGVALAPDARKAVGGGRSYSPASPENGIAGPQVWMKARQSVSVPIPQTYIQTYKSDNSPTHFVYFPNCLDDAFETAATTLDDRRRKYPSPAAFAAWVTAQDQVFANCNGPQPVYPDPAPNNAARLVRQDRDYQIAAARFYSLDLKNAEQRFRAIASDSTSPWQHIAAYLVGRALLRQVTLRSDASAAPLARAQFLKISQDSSAGSLAASAKGMVEHLDALERSGDVMASLSQNLLRAHPAPEALAETLRQSIYILTADQFKPALSQRSVPEPFDWVHTLESGNAAHATQQSRSRGSLPWFTAAMILANGKDATAPDLIQKGASVSGDSPAFGTVTYNSIRLRMERGQADIPRRELNALLARAQNQPPSLVNGWRAERMRLATSFDDFLRWAPRTPVGADIGPDWTSPVLAPDSAYVLNFETPLAQMAVATHSQRLPSWSTADVAIAAWTRAFVLGDARILADVAPVVARKHPDWNATLTPPGELTPDWKFQAALLISLHREFQPLITVDYRKHLSGMWSLWWCPVSPPAENPPQGRGDVAWRLPVIFNPPTAMISPEQRATANSELAALVKAGSTQSFLAPIFMEWAKSHPGDPQVPEALHRLVMIVRYGCHIDQANRRISKAAFDLLHQRYPNSEWAKKTPYYFN